MLELKMPNRLDAVNSQEMQEKFLNEINRDKTYQVVCDFSENEYISSAGLRIILMLSKEIKRNNGSLLLKNMKDEVYAIFKMAGFHTIINIERS